VITALSEAPVNNAAVLDAPPAVIDFVTPLLGFETESRFHFTPLEDTGTLWSLESVATSGLRFVVAPPEPFFPDYAPVVDDTALRPLGTELDGLTLLIILTVTGSLAGATANLLAPIVLSSATGRAMQLVLPDDSLPIRAPLLSR
jgi:flagellar assembly factor FliW